MAFTSKDWRDYPDTTTPTNAAAFEDLETRLAVPQTLISGKGSLLVGNANDELVELPALSPGIGSLMLMQDGDGTVRWNRPYIGDHVRYVSAVAGNDTLYTGADSLTPYRTIQKAVDDMNTALGGIVYVLSGAYIETVSITSPITLIGTGTGANGTRILAPSPTAHCINVSGNGRLGLDNIQTSGHTGATWTGVGLKLNTASHSVVRRWFHRNADFADDAERAAKGGTGFEITNTEGCYFENMETHKCQVGFHLGQEASTNTYMSLRGNNDYQHLLIDGNGGGNLFTNAKCTGCGSPTTPNTTVDIGGGGSNTFIKCDWNEAGPSDAVVSSDWNTFIQHVIAPGTDMDVQSDDNYWVRGTTLGALTVSGNNNILQSHRALGTTTVNGSNNLVENHLGTLTGTGMVRRVHSGLPIASAPSGTLAKKLEVFDDAGVSLGFVPVYPA